MNDFARDNELKTRGNRVGPWSLVKTSVLDQKRMCVCGALAHVRFGSKADICSAPTHVRFTPNSDRKSRHAQMVMSALPLKADMCGATRDVRFGPIADIAAGVGSVVADTNDSAGCGAT